MIQKSNPTCYVCFRKHILNLGPISVLSLVVIILMENCLFSVKTLVLA